jgi:chromosome partitioning protein
MAVSALIAAPPAFGAVVAALEAALADAGLTWRRVAAGAALPAGRSALNQAVAQARCLVLVLGPEAETDEGLRNAFIAALNNGRPIIPILAADLRADSWLRLMLNTRDQIDLRPSPTPHRLRQVVEAIGAANATGRVITMLNIKGGVGKTILAANLFTAAHLMRAVSVCYVDLDPQHNLSQYFLSPVERNRARESGRTLHAVFTARGQNAVDAAAFSSLACALNRSLPTARPAGGLDLICGDDRLFEFTLDAAPEREREEVFARFHALIADLRARYDVVVIDTNPCATFLTRCAITASDHIVAPVRPEKYSLVGLTMLEWLTRRIRERPLDPAEFSTILNGVGDRARAGLGDVDAMTRNEILAAPFFGHTLIKTAIPYSGLLRATPDDRYAINPINVTVMMRLATRSLKENLANAAAEILKRANA